MSPRRTKLHGHEFSQRNPHRVGSVMARRRRCAGRRHRRPCRVGTEKATQLMQAAHWDTATLEDLCQVMTDASICGLGQAAPNPLRSVLRYFPQELA